MIALGAEFKLNIHVEPIDGLHMSDYDFECELYVYNNKTEIIKKSKMKKVDDDNYLLMVTSDVSKKIGRGLVRMRFKAYIPDGDFEDGIRTEIDEVCTKLTIV